MMAEVTRRKGRLNGLIYGLLRMGTDGGGWVNGGWGGIRTHGTLAGTPVFKTGALNRSATHPDRVADSAGPHRYIICRARSVKRLRRKPSTKSEPGESEALLAFGAGIVRPVPRQPYRPFSPLAFRAASA